MQFKFTICGVFLFLSLISFSQTFTSFGFGSLSSVNAITVDTTNGNIYVAGGFSTAGTVTANSIAKLNGTQWSPLGLGTNGFIKSVIMYNGNLYAAGNFSLAGGTPANCIAKWNGTNWSALGTGMDNTVFTLAEYNGELYAGGAFSTAGGMPVNNIAKWNGTNWSAVGSGANSLITTLLKSNGKLYVGGYFTSAGTVTANYIASWNGLNWSALGNGTDNFVWSLGEYNGDLILGGDFTQAGSIPVNHIAKWNGSNYDSLGHGVSGTVAGIAFYNCELYVAGSFTTAGGNPAKDIAKWNSITSGWSSLGPALNSGGFGALKRYNGDLYIGGFGAPPTESFLKWTNAVPPFPTASMTVNETSFHFGKSVQFTYTGTNATNFKWSFPGGTPSSSTLQNPKVFYPSVGNFNVNLVAGNCLGTATLNNVNYINVDAIIHPVPSGLSNDFLTIKTPANTVIQEGDYNIHYYKPIGYNSSSPILFYVHGQGGNGGSSADLQSIADRQNAVIVAPTMHNGALGHAYATEVLWNSATSCNEIYWYTQVFKEIYRYVLYREQKSSMDSYLTGFSSGGQFTSRYMLIRQFSLDSIPIKMAVSLNGANYTLMTDTFNNVSMLWTSYRCGLGGGEWLKWGVACTQTLALAVKNFICNEHVKQYYNENYGVLCGTGDTQPFTGFCPGAQGTDRFDRAKKFYGFSKTDAVTRGTTLKWICDSVVGVGHDQPNMYNTKRNVTDTFTIAERMLFKIAYHTVAQLTPSCLPIGINELDSENYGISLYPNPNSGSFILKLDKEAKDAQLIIINTLGQKVFAQKIVSRENIIDVKNLSGGLYNYILYKDGQQIKSDKIVIE